MAKKTKLAALLLCLALGAAAVQAQDAKKDAKPAESKPAIKVTDIATTLKDRPLATALLNIAGVTKPVSNPNAKYTFLLPTEAALAAFLKDMGLTVDDLKARPALAKALVGQHLIQRANVREQEIFEKGDTRKAASAVAPRGTEDLTFKRNGPGKFTVTDSQGNTANIDPKPLFLDENKTVHFIDRVLMGDKYFTSFASLCKIHAKRLSAFCDAVKTTGLGDALSPKGGLDATVFVPSNPGLVKATAAAKPSKEALTNILKYHVVPGARELPRGWKANTPLPTLLKGQDLKIEYKRLKADGSKRKFDALEALVVPAGGTPVRVLKANVHVGKAVVQGVGDVLLPGNAAAAATSTEAGKKAATTPATTTPAAGAEAGKKATTTPAAAAPKDAGRKLLWDWGSQGGATAEEDAAAGAIQNAVDGNESVAAASQQSLVGAEQLSVPDAYNLAEDGVYPW